MHATSVPRNMLVITNLICLRIVLRDIPASMLGSVLCLACTCTQRPYLEPAVSFPSFLGVLHLVGMTYS
jgi:hypothetical protein